MKYVFWIPHCLRSQKLLRFPRFHGGKEEHGEEMPFEKVLLKQMIKTFQESHKVSRLQGQAYNTQGLRNKKVYYKQLKNSLFFSFIPKIHIHRSVQAKKITTGQQPENS